jgi:DNA-binding transcriptional ArsR family regulator
VTRPIENISDPRYVKALSHPLRVRILAILDERIASPLELSRMLRTELGVVAYHVRTLHRLGLIKLERETKVRGATQRHYKAIERPRISNEAWGKAPPIFKQALIDATLNQIHDYARDSAAAGGFDRADAHVTRTNLRLDRRGWEELGALLMDLLRDVARIEGEVEERTAAGETHTCDLEDIGLVIMFFQALPFSAGLSDRAPASTTEHSSPNKPA